MSNNFYVRVCVDVAALDRELVYIVPAALVSRAHAGTQVRVELNGRRVAGWITEVGLDAPDGLSVRDIAHIRGIGPSKDILALARWASKRWVGPLSAFLDTASSENVVSTLPASAVSTPTPASSSQTRSDTGPSDSLGKVSNDAVLIEVGPRMDRLKVVRDAISSGPTLVCCPTHADAQRLVGLLRREQRSVAHWPNDWAAARAGCDVVVGSRSAVWASTPEPGSPGALRNIVVLDAHDDALVEERSPTWDASTVARERARRLDINFVAVTFLRTPSLEALCDSVVPLSVAARKSGWGAIDIVDLRQNDPIHGLLNDQILRAHRGDGTVVTIVNRIGRAHLVSCVACNSIARCEVCGHAVREIGHRATKNEKVGTDTRDVVRYECPACFVQRPAVCLVCKTTRHRTKIPGVSKIADELGLLLGEKIGELTKANVDVPTARVIVGTEAALRRIRRADRVVFLDFDQQLFGTSLRSAEKTMHLVGLAARMVGSSKSGGVTLQTSDPEHAVVQAVRTGDFDPYFEEQRGVAQLLKLPPFGGLAEISGHSAPAFVEALQGVLGVEIAQTDDQKWLARAATSDTLSATLREVKRPSGRLRIAVDPRDL